jgi:uncharacterized protein YbjT (DUF2867 family)
MEPLGCVHDGDSISQNYNQRASGDRAPLPNLDGGMTMLAITGANGHLGRRLLTAVTSESNSVSLPVRALVRSRSAAGAITALGLGDRVEVAIVDYRDGDAMSHALRGCDAVVHLVGILKETARNRYRDAHEESCRALGEAAERAGIRCIVYLSILGAEPGSGNACLASKAAAERILLDAAVPATIIRVPMVLGEGDYASHALSARARRPRNVLLRGASLEQPIYAGDVVAAILAVLAPERENRVLDLAGPEALSRTALVHRAAHVLGRRTRVVSLPIEVGLAAAFLFERVSSNPPVTRAMLGVLDHDDCINPQPALTALGLTLTPLDDTLRQCLIDN